MNFIKTEFTNCTFEITGQALCVYIPEVPVDNDDCDEDRDRVHYECE